MTGEAAGWVPPGVGYVFPSELWSAERAAIMASAPVEGGAAAATTVPVPIEGGAAAAATTTTAPVPIEGEVVAVLDIFMDGILMELVVGLLMVGKQFLLYAANSSSFLGLFQTKVVNLDFCIFAW